MSFSVFFVFGQQLNRNQSERATKAQTVEKELQRWDTFFQLYAEGKTSKANTQDSASTLLIKIISYEQNTIIQSETVCNHQIPITDFLPFVIW